jgi:hypothetical protein
MAENITTLNPKHEISFLNRFLCWFVGVDIDIIKQCPKSEQTKHTIMGGAVLFTGILAFFSSFYAIFMVFQNEILAFFVGIFWALGIINLDKYLIITTKKENQWYNVPIRLVMAIIIGLAVSRPLVLRIFKTEIDEKLQEQLITKQTNIKVGFDSILAQNNALSVIDDVGVFVIIWIITLLLIMFEITPILLKVTTKSGCYENLIEKKTNKILN